MALNTAGHERSGTQTEKRVLFVEFATHFGGALLSLSELLQGMGGLPVKPYVLAFQKPEVVKGLFPGIPVFLHTRHTSHLTRISFRRFIDERGYLKPLRRLLMKMYAVFDYIYGFYFTFLILRIIKREAIDVLHTNNGLNVNGLRAAAWAGIPCVAHMRGRITGKTTSILQRNWKHVEKSLLWAVAISEYVYRTGLESGVPANRLVTIHDPIDLAIYDRACTSGKTVRERHGITSGRVVVGAFGRVIPFKGQLEFLEAAARIAPELPALLFLIVGDPADSGDPAYWARVKALAQTPPLKGKVIFCGYRKDVEAYYYACEIVVHSAIGPEGFGRVVVEAMACSKPVIASDEGGPQDIVTSGEDGILVPPRSVSALAEAIRDLAQDSIERSRLGKAGRDTVERRFSAPVIAPKIAALYRD